MLQLFLTIEPLVFISDYSIVDRPESLLESYDTYKVSMCMLTSYGYKVCKYSIARKHNVMTYNQKLTLGLTNPKTSAFIINYKWNAFFSQCTSL